MNDSQLMHAMSLDDTYRVEQVLARGEDGITELVTIDGAGPFVRKKDAARARPPQCLVGTHRMQLASPPPSRGRRHRQRKLHRQLC